MWFVASSFGFGEEFAEIADALSAQLVRLLERGVEVGRRLVVKYSASDFIQGVFHLSHFNLVLLIEF